MVKHRKKMTRRASSRQFTNSALNTKQLNLSAKPRRGGIRM